VKPCSFQFEAGRFGDRVLLASDGLCKYALLERICTLALRGPVEHAAVDCVRLPSGTLQDDVAVVLVSA
jgi:hypothetical protein